MAAIMLAAASPPLGSAQELLDKLSRPSSIGIGKDGKLYVYEDSAADGNAYIRGFSATTPYMTTILRQCPDEGPAPKDCFAPVTQLTPDPTGGLLLVEFTSNRIRRYDLNTHVFTTIAGDGTLDFKGDGGPATVAGIAVPQAVVWDREGNLFISTDHRIRRIEAHRGVISTIAGTGVSGFSGDGGPAEAAQFSFPQSLAFDSEGQLYVADGRRIRKIDTKGVIQTVAGTGDGSHLNFEQSGPSALTADLYDPTDLAFGPDGALYFINDASRVLRFDPATGNLTTVVGTGEPGTSGDGGPAIQARIEVWSMAIDASGNLYLGDWLNSRVRRVDRASGIITTIAGSRVRSEAGFQ